MKQTLPHWRSWMGLVCALFLCTSPLALADNTNAPPELSRWAPWVLHGSQQQLCPPRYNNGAHTQCAWPSHLALSLSEKQGTFTQNWRVFETSWLPLPGAKQLWPNDVKANGKAVIVISKNGVPTVHLKAGQYTITGSFRWSELPRMLNIPPQSGLVTLNVSGKTKIPNIDKQGRLWLQKKLKVVKNKEFLEVRVFRLLQDSIPMRAINLFQLTVSGRAREITLDDVLLKDNVAMRVDSRLPTFLDKGKLKVQVRPGQWSITIQTRFKNTVSQIGPITAKHGRELWAFRSHNHLRLVKVLGVPSTDPGQTHIPNAWRKYPVYILEPNTTMKLKTLRRGDPNPAPDNLRLQRTWWLDFEGKGYTILDQINGTMSQHWSLTMNPSLSLGRITVSGQAQLITRQDNSKKAGVELRHGSLNMQAISRYEGNIRQLPAIGWDHNFQSVSATLYLPPGYRLLTATGVDRIPGTWFQRWSLLDLFLVLIIALVTFKLAGIGWGLLALITLFLTYHERNAPQLVWLSLLASLALLSVIPEGWFRKLVNGWRIASIVALLVISIPFMIKQARHSIYPQLASQGRDYGHSLSRVAQRYVSAPSPAFYKSSEKPKKEYSKRRRIRSFLSGKVQQQDIQIRKPPAVLQQDPNALIQTGPGLPSWRWKAVQMYWNGPVDKHQKIQLWLLTPTLNLALGFLRVILLLLLIIGLVGLRRWWQAPKGASVAAAVAMLFFFLPMGSPFASPPTSQPTNNAKAIPSFPSKFLLEGLRTRLLKKPECLPNCAHFSRMQLHFSTNQLTIQIEAHAASQIAVPLPGKSDSWLPQQILLNGKPINSLERDKEGLLWTVLPKGLHRLTLIGTLTQRNTLELPLPLKPSQIDIQSKAWKVEGVDDNGNISNSLMLTRLKKAQAQKEFEGRTEIRPYLKITRVFQLGLPPWQILTTVKRLTPTGTQVLEHIPLLQGESVTSRLPSKDGKVQITMAPKTQVLHYRSTLKVTDKLHLMAPKGVSWTEEWVLDASPIWHCSLSGIPVIHHQNNRGLWRPTWRPWPGETVDIQISRPKGIAGQTLTIESAHLYWTPGKRFSKSRLQMNILTSHGKQHRILLPKGAKLQQVKIGNKTQPIGKQDREVLLPLTPGRQQVLLEWNRATTSGFVLHAPKVKIGQQAVNAKVTFYLGYDRWLLWARGPRMGPAVLFWSYLFIVFLAAFALGFLNWTPLKTHHWLLLSLGLTQTHPLVAITVVGWLLVLSLREKRPLSEHWMLNNLIQIGLVAWTVASLIGLYSAIHQGLLGIPHMQISGNGSYASVLHWTQDRIATHMPQPWVLALPKWVFRVGMLLWALWLALSLVSWLRWGWQAFTKGGLWTKPPHTPQTPKPNTPKNTPPPMSAAESNKPADPKDDPPTPDKK